MPPTTPYSKYLGTRDPLAAVRDTTERIRALTRGWSAAAFERTYAPGKWTARQILIHLAHAELALGNRARMAASTPGYVAQAFNQDKWLEKETRLGGSDALDAFVTLSRMNLVYFEGLSADDRQIALTHPEYGAMTIDWIVHTIAGHQLNHLQQLEQIAGK